MKDADVPFKVLSRLWTLGCALFAFVASLGLDRFLVPGAGKAAFFAIFMTGCAVQTAQPRWGERSIVIYLAIYGLAHLLFVVAFPKDDQYAGALLLPLAVLDYILFAKIYEKIRLGLGGRS